MKRKIAILRGINVGGKRKILMADLKSLCEKLGWENLETYIQSGNLIFNSNKQNLELENSLQSAITEKFGFDVPVILRTVDEIERAITNNPFYKKDNVDLDRLFLVFLKNTPTKENRIKAESYNYEPDKFIITKKEVYVFCEGQYHKSKLTNNFFESKLKTTATTRNWKTVLKLLELSKT